ncbi:1-deoxy-D-xylulose-5-phosphate reductoisomerase [Eubacterium oxidoreducens]|uniref:1-deoxy-D-xylulose 5-phosphate reductoisomerase n=1 Tax=Eubacterium oxidoreducens TaxID=1732 RepID=A0A1G6AP84_EUBOX|nr:1-deoxy-D-xylulose-5-phosphate reductoisomerase [Eubacterium oxidoreducens]SDB10152.1 1-deoxy-D-xylulose 5-phosphate reductoisomerase [Eubacterium oxidoreducens]
MRKIAILGSTGSIGTQTLQIVEEQQDIEVTAIAAGRNIKLLEKQIRKFHPKLVAVWKEESAKELKNAIKDMPNVRITYGMEGLIEVATFEKTEILVTAIVGMLGILPTIEAIKAGKDIALANKETLVCAGHIIMPLAAKLGVKILPVDSEHSAIFQSLNGERHNHIAKIHLTASGGPFRGKSRDELKTIQLEDALNHPNWVMGKKVTIDSSTLVNKGLEVMEAHWLFGVDADKINVVVHPQSVIHSMVEYEDGAVIAQLGTADMRLPIQYALYYPARRPLSGERVDFFRLKELTFEAPDLEVFSGLKMAFEALKKGGNVPTVFNAANEVAVAKFLKKEISYLQITEMIQKAISEITYMQDPTVEQILQTESMVRELLR